jgi:hypothetical protein
MHMMCNHFFIMKSQNITHVIWKDSRSRLSFGFLAEVPVFVACDDIVRIVVVRLCCVLLGWGFLFWHVPVGTFGRCAELLPSSLFRYVEGYVRLCNTVTVSSIFRHTPRLPSQQNNND